MERKYLESCSRSTPHLDNNIFNNQCDLQIYNPRKLAKVNYLILQSNVSEMLTFSVFDWVVRYLNTGLDSYIPLTFMLGFFVSFVVGRWGSILSGLGWIDE